MANIPTSSIKSRIVYHLLNTVNQIHKVISKKNILVKKEKNGVRESVHIHRDIDRDSHAFR